MATPYEMQNKGIQLKPEIENIQIGTINHSSIFLFMLRGEELTKPKWNTATNQSWSRQNVQTSQDRGKKKNEEWKGQENITFNSMLKKVKKEISVGRIVGLYYKNWLKMKTFMHTSNWKGYYTISS